MKRTIQCIVLLLVVASFMAVLTPCPNATRVNGMRCDESSGVTLLSRDALFQRMADAVQREEDEKKARELAAQEALETRLKRHCAARETDVCAAVARLQGNMLDHPRADHWWIDGVNADIGFCAMNAMFRIGFTTSFRLDTGVLRVEKGHRGYLPESSLAAYTGQFYHKYHRYEFEGHKNHGAISFYFEYLERNAASPSTPSTPSPSSQSSREDGYGPVIACIVVGFIFVFTFLAMFANVQ